MYTRLLTVGLVVLAGMAITPAWSQGRKPLDWDVIEIRNPRKLGVDRLPAERVPVGAVGNYKPCVVNLEGDELLLVCYLGNVAGLPGRQYRSSDGGRTWSDPEECGVDGGEPCFTRLRDGSLFIFNHWRRSENGGRTWVRGTPPADLDTCVALSRNVLELKDGSLLGIVGEDYRSGNEYVARSTDGGLTWPETHPVQVEGIPEGYTVFGEAHLWQARSGKLYAVCRVDHRDFPLPGRVLSPQEMGNVACSLFHYGYPLVRDLADAELDQLNHLKVFSSTDLGRTWQPAADLGDYGYMYPSILRLQDGRLLLTFTVRTIDPPLGVRAVLGVEEEDGFQFDFEHDMIMIDTKNPIGRCSGGGFGPTTQLDDGSLVTSYSYWPDDTRQPGDWSLPNPSQCEVVRWRLPAAQ